MTPEQAYSVIFPGNKLSGAFILVGPRYDAWKAGVGALSVEAGVEPPKPMPTTDSTINSRKAIERRFNAGVEPARVVTLFTLCFKA